METTTQPILCCIGQKVAGKPTQFLMERAIAAEQLDWRAITVEVSAEHFATAVAGMAVMKFVAVRFFSSLEPIAQKLLVEDDPLLQFVGAVTSATWSPSGWTVWHQRGLAIRQWATRQADFSKTICWLHGDSVHCRSFLAALKGQGPPQAIVWSRPPDEIPDELTHFGQGDAAIPLHRVASGKDEQLHLLFAKHGGATSVLWIGDEFQVVDVQLRDAVPRWLVVSSDEAKLSNRKLGNFNGTVFSEVDQIVACEAYDFHRWTGRNVDTQLLRDAYDEYCDF